MYRLTLMYDHGVTLTWYAMGFRAAYKSGIKELQAERHSGRRCQLDISPWSQVQVAGC